MADGSDDDLGDGIKGYRYLSCDINDGISVTIDKVYGRLPVSFQLKDSPLLHVTAFLLAADEPIVMETVTRNAKYDEARGVCQWGEELHFGARVKDLPKGAVLACTVWQSIAVSDCVVPIAAGVLPLTTASEKLRSGPQRLRLAPSRIANPNNACELPGKIPANEKGELERLEALKKRYDRGEFNECTWLDNLSLCYMSTLEEEEMERRSQEGFVEMLLHLPMFDFPIIHCEAPLEGYSGLEAAEFGSEGNLVWLNDPEVSKENPAERKAQKLARSISRSTVDKDVKPDSVERRDLQAALRLPPTRPLSSAQKELIWKFRFTLPSEPSALTKFLKSVDWSDANESKQALDLLQDWTSIEPSTALELLSPSFTTEAVREFGVACLNKASDDELMSYLLQLVQALRYEATDDSPLAHFLARRAAKSLQLANFLHWYLVVESQDMNFAPRTMHTHKLLERELSKQPDGDEVSDHLRRQSELIAQLCTTIKNLENTRGSSKKTQRLRALLSEETGLLGELSTFSKPLPLPLNPSVVAQGISPQKSSCFRSTLHPLKLAFQQADSSLGHYVLIFKKGDDLRQDQLCVQLIELMDKLLKKENLDLKLTVYSVLASSVDHGMVEFVEDAANLSNILNEYRTVGRYLAHHNPDPNGPYGIHKDAFQAFIKSCAGYCVITYILGVGDRHLDNIMLTQDGRLFHIDFGYIMGREPKPFAPPVKLCREMVEAMGGTESDAYIEFQTYCCEAYNILRKSAPLVLNLVALMSKSNIPDIAAAPEKVLLKLESKFQLDCDDEEAGEHLKAQMAESVRAIFPVVMETAHRMAQYWR